MSIRYLDDRTLSHNRKGGGYLEIFQKLAIIFFNLAITVSNHSQQSQLMARHTDRHCGLWDLDTTPGELIQPLST